MIVAAAVRQCRRIYALPAPARHGEVLWSIPEHESGPTEQGFIDSEEGFVGRARAHAIARACGQIDEPQGEDTALFSEDVWTCAGRPVRPRVSEERSIELSERTAQAANLVFNAFGPGAQGTLTLAGEAALAAHWRHRRARSVDLWSEPQAWAHRSVQPGAKRSELARLAPHCEKLGRLRDALVMTTTTGTTVRVRPHARGLRPPQPSYAREIPGLEIAAPVEVLEQLWRNLAGKNVQATAEELRDIEWAHAHDREAADEALRCLDAQERRNAVINAWTSAQALGTDADTPAVGALARTETTQARA